MVPWEMVGEQAYYWSRAIRHAHALCFLQQRLVDIAF